MKKIYDFKTFESINLGPLGTYRNSKGDNFAENLIDIIDKENIKILKDDNDHRNQGFSTGYKVNVDGTEYYFTDNYTVGVLIPTYYIFINDEKLTISRKTFSKLKNIYNRQQEKELPDLSDMGRSAKKYNL